MDVGEKRSKNGDGDELDRISVLPVNLRESILECMPIKDAMRTSALARKWRYCWTGMRKLSLNNMECWSIDVFCRIVDKVLLLHNGPIQKFHIVIPDRGDHGNLNLFDWFHVLSKNGIQDIFLDAVCNQNPKFLLPSSLFQCQDLKKLVLHGCKVMPHSNFMGFCNLVDLEIRFCKIPSHMLGSLISQCPLLEKLSLHSTCTEFREQPLVINALNLRVLYIVCYYNGSAYSYLTNTPNLRVASFRMAREGRIPDGMKSNCYSILKSMLKIEVFTFDYRLHKISASDIIPKKLPELLKNLKTVNLHCMDSLSVDQMSFMFCIFRSSPNLQNLTIHLSDGHGSPSVCDKDFWEAVIAYLEAVDKEEIKTSIATVCVTLGRNTAEHIGADIALLDSIISCCPALGNLAVKSSSSLSLKASAKLQLSGALRRYGRSSSKPKIIYPRW